MRAAVYHDRERVTIEDVPEPSPGEGEVKIKVSRNGICGTDLHEYYDGPIFIPPSEPHPLTGRSMPLVLGHEFSGKVVGAGAGVTGVQEGERVAIEPIYRCGHCRPCTTGQHAHVCQTTGDSVRMTQAMAGKGVTPLN